MENFFNVSAWANDVDYGCSALNKTVLLINSYSGIPETLLLNVLAWLLLLILFTILRHQAGDYGRLALINNNGNRKRWTEVFYSRGNSVNEQAMVAQPHVMNNAMSIHSPAHTSISCRRIPESSTNNTIQELRNDGTLVGDDDGEKTLHCAVPSTNASVNGNRNYSKHWTEAFYNSGGSSVNEQLQLHAQSSQPLRLNGTTELRSDMESQTHNNEPHDKGLFSWIIITFKLRKEQILLHTGPDAVYYLSYQQHLMIVMAIVTVVSLVIILPVNFLNGPDDDDYDVNTFGRTTMANLAPDSHWLWIHVFVAITYAPLIVLIMRLSSGRNAFKKAPTRTLMVTNIDNNDRNKTIIRNYIHELFPDVSIEDVQVAYNISKLYGCNAEYERALDARIYCQNHRDRDTLMLRPKLCSCEKVNAYEYYEKQERTLSGDVARLRASALNEPLDIAFITLSTVEEAQNIISHFKPIGYRKWKVEFAPSPDDLFWENLNVSRGHWMLKWAIVNILLFILLFFLTTPAMIVNFLDSVALIKDSISTLSPLVSEFLPTLMLWTLSVLMPVIVAFSDKWMSYYTRSQLNYSMMTKCFGYLLFMILILPSLGLASAEALLLWSVSDDIKRWQCIFLPDRGSFYVNYIITAGFIGTALELLRFPELIVYLWMLLTAKSKAETPYIRKMICIEFPFGIHYAWTTLVFTIAIVYSVFCPLIMPFAMVYICFKHFVDRHNLYFAYGPSNMISRNGGKIHSTAVTMTKFSVVILLLIMAMISYIRGAGLVRALVLIITLLVTLTLFVFMSPIKRCTRVKRPSIVDAAGPPPMYIPAVLKPRSKSGSMALGTNPTNHLYNNIQNGLHNNGPTGLYGGFGSDNVSDFEVSSQCSVNSIGT